MIIPSSSLPKMWCNYQIETWKAVKFQYSWLLVLSFKRSLSPKYSWRFFSHCCSKSQWSQRPVGSTCCPSALGHGGENCAKTISMATGCGNRFVGFAHGLARNCGKFMKHGNLKSTASANIKRCFPRCRSNLWESTRSLERLRSFSRPEQRGVAAQDPTYPSVTDRWALTQCPPKWTIYLF